MAIHTRRPQEPPGIPRFTTDDPPTVAPVLPEAGTSRATIESAAAAAAVGARSAAEARAGSVQPEREGVSPQENPRQPWVRREGWLAALLLSLAPIIALFLAPRSAMLILAGIAGVFILLGVVLFARRA